MHKNNLIINNSLNFLFNVIWFCIIKLVIVFKTCIPQQWYITENPTKFVRMYIRATSTSRNRNIYIVNYSQLL